MNLIELAICAHSMFNFKKFMKISTQKVHLMLAQRQDKAT